MSLEAILKDLRSQPFSIKECFLKSKRRPYFITFINPYSIQVIEENDIGLENIDELYADGFSLAYLCSLFQKKKIKRYSFDYSSIANEVFRFCEKEELKVALIGSTKVHIDEFTAKLINRYKNLNVIYFRDGYFAKSEWRAINEQLRKLDVDVIVVGMGSPLQEQFSLFLKSNSRSGLIFTCGGFYHQEATSENQNYYPSFIDKFNLRFAYRMYREPRLLKRYLLLYPKFLFRFIALYILRRKR